LGIYKGVSEATFRDELLVMFGNFTKGVSEATFRDEFACYVWEFYKRSE
jgi:hypothetical protein